ncbi:MAG: GNAT family N-acetyltransferase [Roseibium sp.]|uniref:GNAT family N-acetyltransferase n=1 Tax=Roseibium sp. TaxID=1936156 RepID=UPI00261A90FC|nr:GNAT family N-acetyltransferase [Roseibium sp.]MCV0429104.1 GNAT family N-acetyltransferase [Roseibium sp.]
MEVAIRRIEATDIDQAAELFLLAYAGPPWNETWSFDTAKDRLKELVQTNGWLGVGAFEQAALIGFSIGVPYTSFKGKTLFVAELLVSPDKQRKGIGNLLLTELQNLARENELCSSWLVSRSSGELLDFYKTNDFRYSQNLGLYSKPL